MTNCDFPSSKSVNALLVVAHPDDETIFCGGTMQVYPTWQWRVVCFTYNGTTPRYKEFQQAMEQYRSRSVNIIEYLTLGLRDNGGRKLTPKEEEVWKAAFQKRHFTADIVFTHNRKGEYDHGDHITVNAIVNQVFSTVPVYEFVIVCFDNARRAKGKEVPLRPEILAVKREIIASCYVSQRCEKLSTWALAPQEFESGPEIFTTEGERDIIIPTR